ncbi:hypothetical protein GCM10011579_032150 [Streptomyces albiflavescens]|uniref:Uncharacterized protein n=1 Tax=Streptomyces albiflavescens TaxID=1623582 RepID=A0A917Y232_9ACTN|nr:hypothetical protein GCM10011579_032150 [Streptomyces albiflavescens]
MCPQYGPAGRPGQHEICTAWVCAMMPLSRPQVHCTTARPVGSCSPPSSPVCSVPGEAVHDCRVLHPAPLPAAGARPANPAPAGWLTRSLAGYALLSVARPRAARHAAPVPGLMELMRACPWSARPRARR